MTDPIAVTAKEIYVCLRCGQDFARDTLTVRRDTGEPWVDPYKPANVGAWFYLVHHKNRCPKRRWWWRNRPRYTSFMVEHWDA